MMISLHGNLSIWSQLHLQSSSAWKSSVWTNCIRHPKYVMQKMARCEKRNQKLYPFPSVEVSFTFVKVRCVQALCWSPILSSSSVYWASPRVPSVSSHTPACLSPRSPELSASLGPSYRSVPCVPPLSSSCPFRTGFCLVRDLLFLPQLALHFSAIKRKVNL